jgi:pimeloyl-ACP methyl ester carboxylesterase
MLREQTFDAGAVTLNYVEGPAGGAPLVLLHGVTGRWQAWLPVMADFAMRWHVYAVDLRGHGRSGHVPDAYKVTDYAGDVIALLRQRVGEPAVVVGHSLGAIVAIAVAAEAPEAVRAIVLEDPPLAAFRHQSLGERPDQPRFRLQRDLARSTASVDELAAELAGQMPSLDAAALRARATALRQMDPDVLTAILEDRAKEGYDLDGRLRRIACPVLLLQGNVAIGGALEDVDARRAAGMLARCTTVQLPQFGHWLHAGDQGQPAIFCQIVSNFLESL